MIEHYLLSIQFILSFYFELSSLFQSFLHDNLVSSSNRNVNKQIENYLLSVFHSPICLNLIVYVKKNEIISDENKQRVLIKCGAYWM